MSNSFRLAIVGTGQVASTRHLPAALSVDGVEVAALVDTIADRARRCAAQAGIRPRICTKVEDLVGHVDGAVIATPNDTHRALATTLLAAGVPVLIEKPIATTVADGEAILAAARDTRTIVAVGFCLRFDDSVELMRDLIAANYFGAIHRFALQWGNTAAYTPLSAYSLNREAAGGGVLVVNGIHYLDRLINWFGEPDDVAYRDDAHGGPEATAEATFVYRRQGADLNGIARFTKTMNLPSGFVMETERGTVVLRDAEGAPVMLHPRDTPDLDVSLRRSGPPRAIVRQDLFRLQIADFVAACREGRPPKVSGEEGLKSTKLIEALYARRQPLELHDGPLGVAVA